MVEWEVDSCVLHEALRAADPSLTLAVDGYGLIRWISGSTASRLGWLPEELLGRSWLRLLHPGDVERVGVSVAEAEGGVSELRGVRVRRAEGGVAVLDVSVVDRLHVQGVHCLLLHGWDVSSRHGHEQELRSTALHDVVTGLPGRALLLDRIRVALERLARSGGPLSVMFLDLRGFKAVNDTAGHAAGDAVLRAVGERLREALRPSDTVARYGGDEFVVLCEGLDEGLARSVGERLVTQVARRIQVDDRTFPLHASLGIAVAESSDADAEDLLRIADDAMYASRTEAAGGRLVLRRVGTPSAAA